MGWTSLHKDKKQSMRDFYRYLYYERLLKVFTDEETTQDLQAGMRLLAEYCKENEV